MLKKFNYKELNRLGFVIKMELYPPIVQNALNNWLWEEMGES